MGAQDLGLWAPMPVAEAAARFADAPFRWWLSGGYALEAHLGRRWRHHGDTDIGLCRADAPLLGDVLEGWDIHVAAAGVLTPWDGRHLDPDRSENNLWCRPAPDAPWALDVTIGDGDEHEWIYRRDRRLRRPWAEAVLTDPAGVPYLAPELQLLFKAEHVRPKDDADAVIVLPALDGTRRSWLADRLEAGHPWQTTIAGVRAAKALGGGAEAAADVELLAAGRSSQAWSAVGSDRPQVVRVPIPNSGRLISYGSEALIGRLLAEAGHPVATWRLVAVDDVDCAVGPHLGGTAIDERWTWSELFASALAALLRDLHRLPVTGWGPLEDRTDALSGTSSSATEGIVDRWFHAPIWPFDRTDLRSHVIASLAPDLVPRLAALEASIAAAATGPFGVVHSDLHRQHLLRRGDELAGLLDFGDAFIGATAWDIALLRWYYGAANAGRVVAAYRAQADLADRGALLAVAVGCYKVAKSPDNPTLVPRLRAVLDDLTATDPRRAGGREVGR